MKNGKRGIEKTFRAENQVHIWQISLDQKDKSVNKLLGLLDVKEKSKAVKFKFEKDLRTYIVSHGAMREILSLYLETRLRNIEFETNSYGKPFLRGGKKDICFNLSHSHELALLAITKSRRIGVDIEFIRPEFAAEAIAEHIFSPLEIEVLRNLPKALQTRAFFDCWTRKEAFIKAVGKGLSYPLKDFSVAFSPFEKPGLVAHENTAVTIENWQIIELEIGGNYAAAMAIEARKRETKLFIWNCSNNI